MVQGWSGCLSMRIAFAYHFNDKDWLGGRNYFASLFSAVREVAPPDLQLVLVLGQKTASTLPEEFPWLEVRRTPLMDRLHPAWLARQVTLRKFESDYLLAWYLSRHRIDLLSHSAYLGPRSSIKTLPWLYDFQFMHLPEYWTPQQVRWSEKRYNDACKHGDGLIVSSEDACRDLRTFAPWCDKPVYVMPFVSNPVAFSRLPTAATIREKYALPQRYFHLPNQFWSNKNHLLAIDALALLKRRGVNATIACTGKPFDARMPKHFDELMVHCRQQGVEDRFKVLGVVPHADLQGLMAHSTAVINPSRFEGWSTSVEEAKTLQKPLLLSDIPVHREQAPGHGRFFPIDDAQALAIHIEQTLQEPQISLNEEAISADYQQRLRAFGQLYLGHVARAMAMAPRGA
jgi:glycosyltransferase involved in cell wall biosynthesis